MSDNMYGWICKPGIITTFAGYFSLAMFCLEIKTKINTSSGKGRGEDEIWTSF